jgi:hypothetical protein
MATITNAAAFLGGRRMKGVDAEYDDQYVTLKNHKTGDTIKRYEVVEAASLSQPWMGAWDVVDETSQEAGARVRLVVQEGCGCSGMRQYTNDPTYSGALKGTR